MQPDRLVRQINETVQVIVQTTKLENGNLICNSVHKYCTLAALDFTAWTKL